MPAEFTLSTAAKAAVATTIIEQLDAGLAAATMELQTGLDVVLLSVPLNYPCGSVDGDGKLVFTPTSASPATAVGTVAKAVFKTSEGAVVFSSNVSLKTGDAFVRLDSFDIGEIGETLRISVGEMTY